VPVGGTKRQLEQRNEGMRSLLTMPLRTYFRYFPTVFAKKALWKHVAERLWSVEGHVKTDTVFGSTVLVNAKDIVGRYIYYFGIWEPNLTFWVSERLREGDIFVDVGANLGYYSLLASKLVGKNGTVIAIEPLSEIFGMLTRNVELNHARNVRAVNVAAWDKEAVMDIFTWPKCPTGVTTLNAGWADKWKLERHGKVRATQLSDILREHGAQAARLIKVDVEGSEGQVIFGMKSILDVGRTDIELLVEVHRSASNKHEDRWPEALDFLTSKGFIPYQLDNSYSAEAYFSRQAPTRPKRVSIDVINETEEINLIFSRIDAAHL
jgi:FkbM family methyltransferase